MKIFIFFGFVLLMGLILAGAYGFYMEKIKGVGHGHMGHEEAEHGHMEGHESGHY
ncbi:MAG: hypothetical protein QMD66_04850 [Actinomycetota bacterium]|nr:hypothetical protein [Actinomycetota bacterium]MDI6822178.1 hypothetical protein [Actinomycetota bacterium]